MAIRLEDVTKIWRDGTGAERRVLDIPRLDLADGDQVCLVGGSGSGKTTLLNVIAGIVAPTSGAVLHDGVDIARMAESKRDKFRAANVGYVFQTFNLIQGLTATENVRVAAGFGPAGGRGSADRAKELLARVGIEERMNALPARLSVGEQQRVAIARAVVNEPRVILADEPTANLDEDNGDAVLALLREVATEQGSILVLVTHETRVREMFEDVRLLAELAA